MITVLWDFDGTLVSSPHMWSCSMHRALLETTPESGASIEDIRRYTPYIFTWSYPERDYSAYKGEKWWDFMNMGFYRTYTSLGLTSQQAQRASLRARELILRRENYAVFPDAADTLRTVKEAGGRNVILSNNIPELEDIMKDIGLHEYFEGFVISAIEGYDKPRKELFEIAKRRFPSERYIMIGDNPEADIMGAEAVGMTTVLVHKGYCPKADYCADTLSQLPIKAIVGQ